MFHGHNTLIHKIEAILDLEVIQFPNTSLSLSLSLSEKFVRLSRRSPMIQETDDATLDVEEVRRRKCKYVMYFTLPKQYGFIMNYLYCPPSLSLQV